MKSSHKEIHEECIRLCRNYIKSEALIVRQLQLVGESKLYRELGIRSLFQYAVEICGLPEGVAYSFISVGKCARLYPALHEAIVSGDLTVSKANRFVSIVNSENVCELVDFAKKNSARAIEREVRRRNPKEAIRPQLKPVSSDCDELRAAISLEASEDIRRSQALLAQKYGGHPDLSKTIALVFADFIERHDPIRKAERRAKRNANKLLPSKRTEILEPGALVKTTKVSARAEKFRVSYKRVPLTSEQKRVVDLRDQRRCTHVGRDGKRCNDDHWIHYHHIVLVSEGGTNEPENIVTLCSFHHDLVHQLNLPLDGEVTWLRSPQIAYGSISSQAERPGLPQPKCANRLPRCTLVL